MKKVHAFNDMIRKVRKDCFGKGPEKIQTSFVKDMAITRLYGNLTPTEKFISSSDEGKDMVHRARTKMIQEMYEGNYPEQLEALVGAKLLHLFTDIKVEEDMAVSVFIFDQAIDGEDK